ncbi:hypothetical protein [Methylobacterium oxalidis]|uniref:hypothetical protein n=1 Tax=Methylobacterium oxalidis TaxID=944322 RepID=UPI003314B87C
MAVSDDESAAEAASRQVIDAEQRRDRQIGLIAGLIGEERLLAQQLLDEIDRTLALARAQRSILLSIEGAAQAFGRVAP